MPLIEPMLPLYDRCLAELAERLGALSIGGEDHQAVDVPQTDNELWEYVAKTWGVYIPRQAVCPGHVSPFTAFADAYFARDSMIVWEASRGLGGKSFMLSILGLTIATTRGGDVNILGGSGEQSKRVHDYMSKAWDKPEAPRQLLRSDPMKTVTRLAKGNTIQALLASSTSVRGSHIPTLLLDEIDEMDIEIFDAAMGQTMPIDGLPAVTVMSCFTPETLVTMADGTVKPIALMSIGDQVMGPGGRRQLVTAIHQKGHNGMIFHCHPKGLPAFFVTSSHVFPTITGEKPIRQAAAEGLISPTWRMTGTETSYMAGWLVGLYLAEGSLRYPTAIAKSTGRIVRSYEVTFSLHRHEAPMVAEIIEKWAAQRYPGKKRPICGRIYEDGRGLSSSLRVTSRGLHGLILRHVRGKSCDTKELTFLPGDRYFAEGLLRGWLAGDGTNFPIETSVQFGQEVRAIGSTVSRNLAWQLASIAGNLGWNVSIQHHRQNGMGWLDVWSLNLRSFFDSRQNQAFRYRGNREIPYTGIVRPTELTIYPYTGDVYDLTVEPEHHYVAGGVLTHNSTHHYPDGTMTAIKKRAASRGWPIKIWCYKESLEPHGWLAQSVVDQKKYETTEVMFNTEYDLQEPSPESRAIMPDAVRTMFDRSLGVYEGRPREYIEAEPPVVGARYAHGADWAKSVDWTEIVTIRTDVKPARLVAYERMQRMPWPQMVKRFEDRQLRYGLQQCRAAHDGTGLGDVIDGYLTQEAEKVVLVGRTRSDLFSNHISAIENGELLSPHIESLFGQYLYCSVDDLYGSDHPPDGFVAGAMAWYAKSLPPKRRWLPVGT